MLKRYFLLYFSFFSLYSIAQDLPDLEFKDRKRLFSKNNFTPGPIFNASFAFNKRNFQLDMATISYRFNKGLEPYMGFGLMYNITKIPLSNLDRNAHFFNAHLNAGIKYTFFDGPVSPYIRAGAGIGFSSLVNDNYLDSNTNGSDFAEVGLGIMITPKETFSIFFEANQHVMRLRGRHTLSNGNEFIYRTYSEFLLYRIGVSIYLY